jgi:hypothetical protein
VTEGVLAVKSDRFGAFLSTTSVSTVSPNPILLAASRTTKYPRSLYGVPGAVSVIAAYVDVDLFQNFVVLNVVDPEAAVITLTLFPLVYAIVSFLAVVSKPPFVVELIAAKNSASVDNVVDDIMRYIRKVPETLSETVPAVAENSYVVLFWETAKLVIDGSVVSRVVDVTDDTVE